MNAAPWMDDADGGEGVWVRGIDYVAGWMDAADAAAEFNTAVKASGLNSELLRATPHTGPHGEGRVWLSPTAVRFLSGMLGSEP